MTNNYDNMISYIPHIILVGIGKGSIITVGYRDAEITIYTSAGLRRCTFTKVLHVLELSTNLLSTEALREKGVFYRSNRQQLFMRYNDSTDVVIADVYSHNGLPYLVTTASVNTATALASSKVAAGAYGTMLV